MFFTKLRLVSLSPKIFLNPDFILLTKFVPKSSCMLFAVLFITSNNLE